MKHTSLLAAGVTAALCAATLTSPALAQSWGLEPPPDPQQVISGLAHAATTPVGNPLHGYDPFYDDPVTELGAPGTLLRTEAAPHLLNLLGPDFPGYAEKILYTSTTVHGDPVATSGFVIQPANKWAGSGPTPTVVFAPGTRGDGDNCAPSRGPWLTGQLDTSELSLGTNYALPVQEAASLLGIRVVVADLIGQGTPGPQAYLLHDEEAHAVLDAARAVVPAGDPIAIYGYSQGGGAAAAAAESHSTYAPELNLKGTYAGAVPSDILKTLEQLNSSILVGALTYPIEGWSARYPEFGDYMDSQLNERGRQFVADNANSCLIDGALKGKLTDTRTLTTTGETLAQVYARSPHFDEQKLGRRAPTTPIMVATGGGDEVVPASDVIELARNYCAAGVNTTLLNENIPSLTPGIRLGVNHAVSLVSQVPPAAKWIMDRFNDVPAESNCGTF